MFGERKRFLYLGLVFVGLVGFWQNAAAQAPATSGESETSADSETSGESETSETATSGDTAPIDDLPRALRDLESGDRTRTFAAIDAIVRLDDPAGIPPLIARVRGGVTDDVLQRALEALRRVAHPSSVELLLELARHRRYAVRREALQALARIRDPRVEDALRQGLRDVHPRVRAIAATELGQAGSVASLPDLFAAFERGVIEAAGAIGKLGDSEALARFHSYLGNRPLSTMLSGYREALARSALESATRLRIIDGLAALSTPAVRAFLSEYLTRVPRTERSLRRAIEDAIRQIPRDAEQRPTAQLGAREERGAPEGGAP